VALELADVWLDDRRRCRWALRGVDLVVEPGSLVALVAPAAVDEGGPEGVFDLAAGRRQPVRGRVAGASRDAVEVLTDEGEHQLYLPDGTLLVRSPTPATLAAADAVVDLVDGTRPLAVWRQ